MKTRLIALSALLALGLTGTASAVPTTGSATFDLGGAFSCDDEAAACNYTALLDFGTGVDTTLDFISWDLTIETVGASWLSEPVLSFGSDPAIFLTPGVGVDQPGVANFVGGPEDLAVVFGETVVAMGGVMTLEIFESFDDVAGEIDAFFLDSSSVSFDYSYDDGTSDGGGDDGGDDGMTIPEPGILVLFGLGLLGMIGARRRRV